MRRLVALTVLTTLTAAGVAEAAGWRAKLLRDLAQTATAFDAVLQSPASEPSPAWGSAIKAVTDEATGLTRYDVMISACTPQLRFKDVPASGDFSKVVQTELTVSAGASYDVVALSGGFSNKQVGGLEYHLTHKRILDPESVDGYRRCCVLKPDQCQDQVITEWWKGTGAYYYLANSAAEAKLAVKAVKFAPQATVNWSRGWGVSMRWPSEGAGRPAYPDAGWQDSGEFFAYRAQPIRVPTCTEYMADAPEKEGHTLFVGVSDFFDGESRAKAGAREDVLKQIASACGTEVVGSFDDAQLRFGDTVFGAVDAFACVDREDIGGAVQYRGRNRVWIPDAQLQACIDAKKPKPPEPPPAPAPEPAPAPRRR